MADRPLTKRQQDALLTLSSVTLEKHGRHWTFHAPVTAHTIDVLEKRGMVETFMGADGKLQAMLTVNGVRAIRDELE